MNGRLLDHQLLALHVCVCLYVCIYVCVCVCVWYDAAISLTHLQAMKQDALKM
jgi:hypothetical protein